MPQKIKLTALAFLSCILCLSIQSRAQSTGPSIVGKWTETKSIQANRHEDKGFTDTTFADYEGCSVTFTADNHFHDVSLKSTADGDYAINGDTLREIIPALNKFVGYKVLWLSDHALIIYTTGYITEPPTITETTITYSR
jgi:hypothetical protein